MQDKDSKIIHSSFWSNFFNHSGGKSDLINHLASVPLFSDFSKKDLQLLLSIVHDRSYLAGEFIFFQNDPGIGIYIINEGSVVIRRSADDDTFHTLAELEKGDFFGELALVDGEKRSASAVAKTDTRLAVIFKPDLDEFIERYPRKGVKILKGISRIITLRLRKLNEEHFIRTAE